MAEKRSYVVVFPDGHEHFAEVQRFHPESFNPKGICEDAVRQRKITTSRKNPQKVAVELFALEINQGQLKRRKVSNYEVMPYLDSMTADEYNEELQEAIDDLPPEFQEFVRSSSYDRGHSSGYEEVVNIAKEMAGDLLPYVQRYQKRIMQGLV